MKGPELTRRLSGVDAAFLYLERKEIPLHIASVALFDGPIPFDEFVAAIESRLHLIPRYRQIVVAPPLNIGYPTWEADPYFEISRHIFHVRLDPPGGEAELEALASRILGQVLDRNRPLWDIHVVDGLKDGRGALIARVHHSLADGISGAALLNVMLDPTPEGSRPVRKPRRRPPPPAPANHSLADALSSAVRSSVENLITAEAGVLQLVQALASGRLNSGLEGLIGLLPELTAAIERLPFNKPCTGDRKFCWAEMEFADVQAIRAKLGGTVNDVVLTVVTRALARYVKLHGQTVKKRFVRIVVPVSLRKDEERESLGNRLTFLPVVLPMDVRNPAESLRAVATRMEIMKRARAGDLLALVAGWLGVAPPPVQALLWKGISQVTLPVPLFNMICTNVPGSPVPLYAAGRRMLTSYPHVPTGYDLGVNIAAQTYDGRLFFGLTADPHAAPDVGRLRDFMQASFQELCRSAGVRKPRPHATPSAGPARRPRPRVGKAAVPAPEPVPAPVSEPEPAVVPEESAPQAAMHAEAGQ